MNADPTVTVESFLTTLLTSLDSTNAQSPALQQLTQQPRVIINGHPFTSKQHFQQLWSTLPLSNHQVTSCDIHFIPTNTQNVNGLNNSTPGQFIVLAHAKVRFDESGRNKLGDTTLLHQQQGNSTANRAVWSHWFGITISCVIDSSVLSNPNSECVSTWDYRFVERPTSSIFKVE